MVRKITKELGSKKAEHKRKSKVVQPKVLKPIKKNIWANLTIEDCIKSIQSASHLSSKSVNSNAKAVGVRLNPADRLLFNFVAVSTLDAAKIPVDYVFGAGDSPALKQIVSVLDGKHQERYTDIDPAQISMIEALRPMMLSGASVGVDMIDARLRQVIWPTGNEDSPWVALTPLQSSGLSLVIRDRLIAEANASIDPITGRSTIYRAKAMMGFGGAHFQNIGLYARSMQSPLVFNGPFNGAKENKNLRLAYALHFNGHLGGLAFAAPREETLAFARWWHSLKFDSKVVYSNLDIRQTEREHIRSIAFASLNAAAVARDVLEQHREYFKELTDKGLDPFLRTLIDPALRDKDFKKIFAKKLIQSVERFAYEIGDEKYTMCGDGELADFVSVVEEVAL